MSEEVKEKKKKTMKRVAIPLLALLAHQGILSTTGAAPEDKPEAAEVLSFFEERIPEALVLQLVLLVRCGLGPNGGLYEHFPGTLYFTLTA